MLRNQDYWKPGYPKVDRLVFRFLPTERQLDALKSGTIDLSTEFPGTQTTEAMRGGTLKILKAPSFYTVTGSFNIESGPLRDKRVRQALNHAVNKDDLVRYDLMGNGRPLATVTMEGEEGHDASLEPYAYDRVKALKLLKEAGYADGFTLRALVKAQGERAARIIADHLARVGVKLDVTLTTDAEVVKDLTGGSWDVFIAGCPDPMAHSFFIQSIYLYGQSPYKVGRNPGYDARLEKMVATLDDGERRGLAEELDRYMHEEALLMFLYQRIKTYGARKDVVFEPAVTGMPYFMGAGREP
jgi:peptide/nickel transport system substrate-binding protein